MANVQSQTQITDERATTLIDVQGQHYGNSSSKTKNNELGQQIAKKNKNKNTDNAIIDPDRSSW